MAERINPYMLFVGSFIPNWLLRRSEVSGPAKLAYARLAQYAGKNGRAYPKMEELALELGIVERSLRRHLTELEDAGLIETKQRGMGAPNDYYFLRHPWMDTDVSDQDRTDLSGLDRTDVSDQDRTTLSGPTIKRIRSRESDQEKDMHAVSPDTPKQTRRSREAGSLELTEAWRAAIRARYGKRWTADALEFAIADAANYYEPAVRAGKYKSLAICIEGSLRRKAEKEDADPRRRQQQHRDGTRDHVEEPGAVRTF